MRIFKFRRFLKPFMNINFFVNIIYDELHTLRNIIVLLKQDDIHKLTKYLLKKKNMQK